MSRIKPHGPVSPHFMTHHYGAAKPAPATDDTALLRQALDQNAYLDRKLAEDEALLRQALEALENGKRVRNCEGGTLFQPPLEDAAIAALRERLEGTK
jgi:hypothetical protein